MTSSVKKKSNNYISLQEAAKHCSYSQEYLSLRARQGKLKAIKIGRNWATKKDWLKKYLSGIKKYNNNNLKNKKAKKVIKAKKVKIKVKEVKKKILPARRIPKSEGKVPKNLPVGEIQFVKIRPFYFRAWELVQEIVERKLHLSPSFFKFTWAVVLILIIAGAVLGRGTLKNISKDISYFVETFKTAGSIVIEERIIVPIEESFFDIRKDIKIGFSKVESEISEISKDQIYSAAVYDTIEVFGEYGHWLGDTFRGLVSKVEEVPAVAAAGEILGSAWQDIKKGYCSVSGCIGENFLIIEDIPFEFGEKIINRIGKLIR